MIGAISKQVENVPVTKKYIGAGENALINTLGIMKSIINKSFQDYYVRRWTEKITEGTGRHDMDKLKAIYSFLVNHVEYCKDTQGVEMLKTPKLVLQLIEMGEVPQIDCDCMTMLALSLAKSVGLPVAMRAIAIHPKKQYSHVYGLVKVKHNGIEKWIPIDLTRPDFGFGWEHPMASRVKDVRI